MSPITGLWEQQHACWIKLSWWVSCTKTWYNYQIFLCVHSYWHCGSSRETTGVTDVDPAAPPVYFVSYADDRFLSHAVLHSEWEWCKLKLNSGRYLQCMVVKLLLRHDMLFIQTAHCWKDLSCNSALQISSLLCLLRQQLWAPSQLIQKNPTKHICTLPSCLDYPVWGQQIGLQESAINPDMP